MDIGERIKALRKENNMTLRELSKKIGISVSFLSDIENGRSNPSLERLKDIAEGLGTTVSYLLGENDKTKTLNNEFSKRLKKLRKEKGLTQEELAQALNITRSALSLYEIGKRDPDTETLRKIAGFFNVSVDYLLGRTDIRNPESSFSSLDEKIAQIMKELGPEVTMQFYDLKGMSEEEKENLIIFLQGLKARRQQKENKKKR